MKVLTATAQTQGLRDNDYVNIEHSGDQAEVSCFQEPPEPTATVSYELYFFPVA